MKKNAFTFIELLAVIVILAMIAVITVPLILDIVENAKEKAVINSAYGFNDSVSKGYLTGLLFDNTKKEPSGTFIMMQNGNMTDSESNVLITNTSGSYPEEDSWIELDKGKIVAFSLKFGDYVVTKYIDTNITVVKGGEIAENTVVREARLESERQASAILAARVIVDEETGTTGITDITEGWVAFINGSLKAYSLRIIVGDYTYIVNDNDVNSSNSNAVASRLLTEVLSKETAEQLIIDYYSGQVTTKASNYVAALLADSTISAYTKDTGKKVSEISIPSAPTGIDPNSWVYFKKETSSVTVPDYSLKFTEGGYTFVVNSVEGTVSSPIYNGELLTQKKPVSFADDSWEDIVTNLTANRNYYPIGSTKIIEFDRDNVGDDGYGTDEYYKLRLVNTSPCSSSTAISKTSCGVVIEFVTIIGTHRINSTDTNVGGWASSEMRSYLNTSANNIFSKLPSDLQEVIIPTAPIVSGTGMDQVSNTVVATSEFDGDKLYLLSGREEGYSISPDNRKSPAHTNILEYYNMNGVNKRRYSTTTSSGVDSTAVFYWLRSAHSSKADEFLGIGNDNDWRRAKASHVDGGVAPAFRILD